MKSKTFWMLSGLLLFSGMKSILPIISDIYYLAVIEQTAPPVKLAGAPLTPLYPLTTYTAGKAVLVNSGRFA